MTSLTSPVPRDARRAARPADAPVAGAIPRAIRAVVVDDHPLYREGIVRALDAAGILVVAEGGDGQAALDLIREHRPDVALLDVSMPLMDGIEVVAAVARGRLPVPVVLLSAFGDQSLVLSGLQAGAATYIGKTAEREQIVQAVIDAADPSKAPCRLVFAGDLMPGQRNLWMPRPDAAGVPVAATGPVGSVQERDRRADGSRRADGAARALKRHRQDRCRHAGRGPPDRRPGRCPAMAGV